MISILHRVQPLSRYAPDCSGLLQLLFAFREMTSRADTAGFEQLAACNVHLRYTRTAQAVAQSFVQLPLKRAIACCLFLDID